MKVSQKKLERIYKRMTPEQRVKSVYESIKRDVFAANTPLPPSKHGEYCLIETDIKKIKVSAFIKAVVHGDYSGIIYDGNPTDKQLSDAMDNIMFQYHDAVTDTPSDVFLKQSAVYQRIAFKINTVKGIIRALMISGYYKPLTDELKEWGYNYPFTEETLTKDIERINTAIVRDEIAMRKAGRDINDMQEKSTGKITEKGFYNTLAELRKFENYQDEPIVLADELSLYGYCQALQRYKKHIEHLNKKAA